MKNINKILLGLFVILGVASCNDDDNFGYNTPEATFEIETPQSGTQIVIDSTNMNNIALTIAWEVTGSDSYSVEFAKASTEFAEPFVGGVTDANTISWTAGELNTFLLETVQIDHSVESAIEVRVKNAEGDYSTVIILLVTPYVVTVNELFINGTFNDFDAATAIPMNMIDFNVFIGTFEVVTGDEFNFIEDNVTGETIWQETEPNSGVLTKFGGLNLSGYAEGTYEVTVELVTMTYTIVELTFPEQLYLVGAGVPEAGWNWDSPVQMTLTSEDIMEVSTELVNDAFRFFTENGNWDSGLNYPYFISEGYTIDPIFEDAMDDSNNFLFTGNPGMYKIIVNGADLTITASELISNARIAVPGNHQGWDPPTAPQLEASNPSSNTDYEGYVWLDGEHKFLAPDANGNFEWGSTDWGDDGSFTGILLDDGEVNCNTSAGYYFIQVNTDALTYSETNYSWAVTGGATALGWPAGPDGTPDQDHDMVYDQMTQTWSVTLDLIADQVKFRANDAWAWNYGDTGPDGFLENGGDNIVVPADGNYTITLDLSVPRAYTYTLTLN